MLRRRRHYNRDGIKSASAGTCRRFDDEARHLGSPPYASGDAWSPVPLRSHAGQALLQSLLITNGVSLLQPK